MSLRICRKCDSEAHTEAELDFFVKDKRLPYGRDNLCKECFNRKYRLGGKHYESRLKAQRKYNKNNRAKIRIRHRAEQKRYAQANPEKIRARGLAQKIPLGPKCEKCDSTENLQRHHPDYSKPLEVITMCAPCNMGVDYN